MSKYISLVAGGVIGVVSQWIYRGTQSVFLALLAAFGMAAVWFAVRIYLGFRQSERD